MIPSRSRNWALLLIGVWILASPWVLGFFEINAARYSNVIAGVLIVVLVMWQLFQKQ